MQGSKWICYNLIFHNLAGVAELADVRDLKSSREEFRYYT